MADLTQDEGPSNNIFWNPPMPTFESMDALQTMMGMGLMGALPGALLGGGPGVAIGGGLGVMAGSAMTVLAPDNPDSPRLDIGNRSITQEEGVGMGGMAASGALLGGMLGSVVPGLGTLLGAGIGGGLGLLAGGIGALWD